ncbi:uncharacterized protein LOC102800610, partial [Saccoglossus kowalevskii]|uniref:Uncharacterized protein LOC102800610 n=1 Tax=Saccoglossus kowalevskii TaxID=10224 RepID=A0ABM0MX62_SACKO
YNVFGKWLHSQTIPVPDSLRSNVQLNQALVTFQRAALSARTIGSYSTGVRAWLRFTALSEIPGQSTSHPRISEDILIYFVTHCATNLHLKYTTIKVYLAGIRNYYILGGYPNPLLTLQGQSPLRRGILCLQGNETRPRLPITVDILQRLCNLLRQGVFGPYFGLRLFPTGTPFCPVTTLQQFLSVRHKMFPLATEPLFLLPELTPLNRRIFTESLRILLARIGLQPHLFAGHSFRIGAATTAASAHIPDHLIQTFGRWSSNCYRTYTRTPESLLQHAFHKMATL